jgi:hypothetical protein
MTQYTEITDDKLQQRVRERYGEEITALQALGFRQLAFRLEAKGPFSALMYLPVLPLMRRAKEVLVFRFPLKLALANVLFVNSEPPTIADCMGMGVKFYTRFSDESFLISSTLRSHTAFRELDMQPANFRVLRNPPCSTMAEAWSAHRRRVSEIEVDGKRVESTGSFSDYVELSNREEQDLRSRQV